MIYIVHGENLSYSRNIILNQQKKLGDIPKTELPISDITPHQLRDMCATFDIFGTSPFVVMDISGAGRMNLDEYISVLKDIPEETTVVVLSSKVLSKANAFIKNADILKAKIVFNEKKPTSNVFRFTEVLFSGNREAAYRELRSLMLEETDPFYIFSMIVYTLRNIALAKFRSPAFSKVAPFARSRVEKQAQKLTEKKVIELYGEMYKMDKELKTGVISPEIVIPLIVEKVSKAYVQT